MRVLMTGGGTGGHVNPALAIAETIKNNIPDAEIAFVGTPRGLENTLVPRAGYKLYKVNVRGFQRKLTLKNIRSAWLALVSPLQAAKIVRKFKPDIVIGTGGYASWPVLVAASRKNIPTAVHESNAVPGLAVRKLVPYVDRIYVNFRVSADQLGEEAKDKILHVGCPLRSDIGRINGDDARRRLGLEGYRYSILSFGGSLGAGRLNETAFELMEKYISVHPEIHYVHATGEDYFEEAAKRFLAIGLDRYPNIKLVKYIHDMPERLAAADLVISRSGAITVSELSRAAKAAILIPSPNVTDNQQYKNARVLADCGGAVLIEEKDLSEKVLEEAIDGLFSDPRRLADMGRSLATVSPSDANERILEDIFKLTAYNTEND